MDHCLLALVIGRTDERYKKWAGKLTINRHLIKYWVTQKLPQINNVNHATFSIKIHKITVQICGNFWVPQHIVHQNFFLKQEHPSDKNRVRAYAVHYTRT